MSNNGQKKSQLSESDSWLKNINQNWQWLQTSWRSKAPKLHWPLTFLPLDRSANAEMTLPSEDRDWLMAAPSFKRSPVAPVDSARSLTNKETRNITGVSNSEYENLPQIDPSQPIAQPKVKNSCVYDWRARQICAEWHWRGAYVLAHTGAVGWS